MSSLVKSPDLTPEKLAANRANARRSRGPTAAQGRERARLSNLRHGLYVLSARDAMIALGEDPREIDLYEQAHACTMIRQEASLARQVERDVRLLRWLRSKPLAHG